jgi:hypothetical protein
VSIPALHPKDITEHENFCFSLSFSSIHL